MEDHPKHHKKTKKTTKTMPPAINIGAGAGTFGMGGIVLFGGALITATLVSAFAFKTRRQRRSPSEKTSSPSPETLHAPNQSPMDLQNSSDGTIVSNGAVTSIEEYEAIEDVSEVDEKARDTMVEAAQGQVSLGDDVAEDEEIPTGNVGENQETVSMNEEAAMEEAACVNQVKVEDNPQLQSLEEENEKDSRDVIILENSEGDSIDETSGDRIVSELAMGEEAIDAAYVQQSDVEDAPNLQLLEEEKEKDFHDEIILENLEGDSIDGTSGDQTVSEELAIDAAYVHQSDVEDAPNVQLLEEEKETDSHDEIILENCEGDLSNKTGSANQSMRADILEMADHEVALDAQELNMEVDDDETEVKQTAQEVEDQVITEDELVNKEEKDDEGEFSKEAKVDDQTVVLREDNPPTPSMTKEEKGEETAVKVQVEMITEDELVKEDKISRVQSIEEDVTVKSEVSSDETEDSSMQEEVTLEVETGNQKTEENMKEDEEILSKEQNDGDRNGITKEDKGSKSAYGKGRKQAAASQPWNLKLGTLSILATIWCVCHWYSELPFPELSLVGSLLFILIILGYHNRTTYLVKYE